MRRDAVFFIQEHGTMSRDVWISSINETPHGKLRNSIVFLCLENDILRGDPLCDSHFNEALVTGSYEDTRNIIDRYPNFSITSGKIKEHFLYTSSYPQIQYRDYSWNKEYALDSSYRRQWDYINHARSQRGIIIILCPLILYVEDVQNFFDQNQDAIQHSTLRNKIIFLMKFINTFYYRYKTQEFSVPGNCTLQVAYNAHLNAAICSLTENGVARLSDILATLDLEFPIQKEFIWYACRKYQSN